MDFFDALNFDSPFLPPVSSITRFTDNMSQLPFIPAIQPPNTSFVRNTYWPSSKRFSPLLGSSTPTNTVQGLPVHRGLQTTQLSFQRPYSYDLGPFLRNEGSAVTYQHHEAAVPRSQNVVPFRIDFNLVSKERKQPPRPANAFMLFRSDFLKRKVIAKDQETRQHRLSIIVAKCWHKLSKVEKEKWFLEAEREKKRHALKYASYKFQPRKRPTKTRREPKLAPSPEEFEGLCRLADVAYQEIINDNLAGETASSPFTISTSEPASSTAQSPTPQIDTNELPFMEGYTREQVVQPTFMPCTAAAAAANLSAQSAQLPYKVAAMDAIRDTGATSTSRGVSHFRRSSRALISNLVLFVAADLLPFILWRQRSGCFEPPPRNALHLFATGDVPGLLPAGSHCLLHQLHQWCSTSQWGSPSPSSGFSGTKFVGESLENGGFFFSRFSWLTTFTFTRDHLVATYFWRYIAERLL